MLPIRPILCALVLAPLCFVGCAKATTSNTARTGTEQLLISNAVDQALNKVDFSTFAGARIQLEDKFLEGVDKAYLLASVRHRLLYHGATVTTDPKDADVVLEVRSGAIGTDNAETFYGLPEVVLPGMMSLPELKFITRSNQRGTAKIGLVAYDAKTQRVLGQGGVSIAVSDQNSWNVLGVGPYKSGSITDEVKVATNESGAAYPTQLPYAVTFTPRDGSSNSAIRLTRGVE